MSVVSVMDCEWVIWEFEFLVIFFGVPKLALAFWSNWSAEALGVPKQALVLQELWYSKSQSKLWYSRGFGTPKAKASFGTPGAWVLQELWYSRGFGTPGGGIELRIMIMAKTRKHYPTHWFADQRPYFISGAIYHKRYLLKDTSLKTMLLSQIRHYFTEYGWSLEHWVVLDNHYHLMARSDHGQDLPGLVVSSATLSKN
ncbi:hypothetical protein WDW89_04930 [Deltaproteobacteria bacterium TL4]